MPSTIAAPTVPPNELRIITTFVGTLIHGSTFAQRDRHRRVDFGTRGGARARPTRLRGHVFRARFDADAERSLGSIRALGAPRRRANAPQPRAARAARQ